MPISKLFSQSISSQTVPSRPRQSDMRRPVLPLVIGHIGHVAMACRDPSWDTALAFVRGKALVRPGPICLISNEPTQHMHTGCQHDRRRRRSCRQAASAAKQLAPTAKILTPVVAGSKGIHVSKSLYSVVAPRGMAAGKIGYYGMKVESTGRTGDFMTSATRAVVALHAGRWVPWVRLAASALHHFRAKPHEGELSDLLSFWPAAHTRLSPFRLACPSLPTMM
jgi:hypothetical protein